MVFPDKARSLPHEIWAQAYDGYYVSNMGRWYSAKSERILSQYPNSSGYFRPDFTVHGERIRPFTHIKVIEFFGDCNGNCIPPNTRKLRDIHLSIDHLNRDKRDNRQSNLELVPHRVNCARKYQ